MSKPRVLLVMHELSRTGAPIVAFRLFQALKADFDIRVVALGGGPLQQQFREAFPLTVLRPALPGGNALGRGRALLHHAFSRAWQPDLVFVNTAAALPTWSRLWALRRHDAPVLVQVREGPVYLAGIEQQFPGLIATEPDGYLTDADWIGTVLHEDFGIPLHTITTVRPPVGDDVLALGLPPPDPDSERPVMIGGAGVPSWMKGPELWLLTAAELVRRDAGRGTFTFRWVGVRDDHHSRQMASMVRKLRLEDRVELVPHTPDHQRLYGDMDIFLMSSWEDPSPVVVLEAMALGKPVVCFRGSGGPPEEVAETGLIVDQFSPAAAADAIEGLAGEPARRASLGAAARARVQQHFALDVIAGQLSAVISGALSGAPQA